MTISRSQPPGDHSPRAHAGTWTVAAVLLAAAVVGTLWVPFYNRATPVLGGFPFYYWYQLIWVPAVAVLSGLAYWLSRRAQRRPARPAAPGDAEGPRPGQEGAS